LRFCLTIVWQNRIRYEAHASGTAANLLQYELETQQELEILGIINMTFGCNLDACRSFSKHFRFRIPINMEIVKRQCFSYTPTPPPALPPAQNLSQNSTSTVAQNPAPTQQKTPKSSNASSGRRHTTSL